MENLASLFQKSGGEFHTPATEIAQKLQQVSAFIFDWDGVFNSGMKADQVTPGFSEIDSMGINLMRYGYWLKTGTIPLVAIITGQENEAAFFIAEREHFNNVFYLYKDKKEAFKRFYSSHGITPEECVMVFDDVLDLSVAKHAGLRFMIGRNANPLLNEFVIKNNYADYISGNDCMNFGVREVCELIMGLHGFYDEVVTNRLEYAVSYQNYFMKRNNLKTYFQKAGQFN
ncbi:phosphatase [Bacteroidota bacterium]